MSDLPKGPVFQFLRVAPASRVVRTWALYPGSKGWATNLTQEAANDKGGVHE